MNVNQLAEKLADGCFILLAINFLWGLYCVLVLWRHVANLKFKREEQQTEFLGTVAQYIEGNDYDSAVQFCQQDDRAMARLAEAAIENRGLRFDALRQLMADMMQRNILAELERRMGWIAIVIKSGPLLGLFGTVLGMMAAFARLGTGEKIQPSQIAKEISIALICTAMGLATAIPFGYLLGSLNNRVRALMESLNFGVSWFLNFLRERQPQPAKARKEKEVVHS